MRRSRQEYPTMKTLTLGALAGALALAASTAGAQTYSTYPGYGSTPATGLVRCESID
jgi:hypothetical protein